MMRFMHVIRPAGIGGCERHLLALLPAMRERGHEPGLVVLASSDLSSFVEPLRAAVPMQIVSNGEYMPPPQNAQQSSVQQRIERLADSASRKLGVSRRRTDLLLLLAVRALARIEGVEKTLLDEWRISLPNLEDRSLAAGRSAAAKGWRWIGEMEEIAATFEAVGLTPRILLGASDMYRWIADTELGHETPEGRDKERDLNATIAALADAGVAADGSALWRSYLAAQGDGGAAGLTIAVQAGFIVGTLVSALANLPDIMAARSLMVVGATLGALANAALALWVSSLGPALALRFATGVCLAGAYPPAMKIMATWFRERRGMALGVLVGALTMGKAMPYLVNALGSGNWRTNVLFVSLLSVIGGLIVLFFVSDGPHALPPARFDVTQVVRVFGNRGVRLASFGYFGHMWELYAFWSLTAFFVGASVSGDAAWEARVPWIAFATVAVGAIGCIGGGLVSRRVPERSVAFVSLIVSGSMCALSGFAFALPPGVLLAYLVVWGVFVVSDSAQFSALAARHAPPEYTGTALTIQNGIGFLVTTFSIQLVPVLAERVTWRWAFVVLTLGPVLIGHVGWGADVAIDIQQEDALARIMDVTAGGGVDVVLDCTSGAGTAPILLGIEAAKRRGATMVIQAEGGEAEFPSFPIGRVTRKGMTLKSARGHSYRAVELALHQLASHRFPLELMTTHTFGLQELDYAIKSVGGEGAPGAIHVSVLPWH